MKKTRFALLVLLVSAIGVVVAGYHVSQKRNRMLAAPRPAPLPENLNSVAKNWSWSRSSKDSPVVQVRSRDVRQIKDSSRFEMIDVELKIFSKAGDSYDLVRSSKAEFDQAAEKLYSDGEVSIVLGLPAEGSVVEKRPVEIRTSGLTYDSKTGVSSTDHPVHFQFEDGEGQSVGAVYDATKRYLWMKSAVDVLGAGKQAGMHIRAGELHYYEAEQKIELRPWCRLERGEQGVEAVSSTIYLDKGDLKRVDAQQAKGWQNRPGREMQFSGAAVEVHFTPERTVGSAAGLGNAEVVSRSSSGFTKINGDRVDLEFATPAGATQSELRQAMVQGKGRVESQPAAAGRAPPETKVLTAEVVKLLMRPGGEEVQSVETHSPGRLDLVPNQPSQWKRTLTSERMAIQYAPGNHPETLRANGSVHVSSTPPETPSRAKTSAPAPPQLTWSDDLQASFDPQTGQVCELRQWSKFRYEEGARKARSDSARFELSEDRITLEQAARVWDEVSAINADRVVLDQKRDRLHAEGNVSSIHSDRAAGVSSAASGSLFTSDRPVQATAQQLDSEQQNRLLHYRGAARLWQDSNSVQAQEIDLDRTEKTLRARGNVVSVLVDGQPSDQQPQPRSGKFAGSSPGPRGENRAASRLVAISAESLLYTDEDRRAFYTGRALMHRDRLTIRAAELETFLRPSAEVHPGESRLERALARGKVEIAETAAGDRLPRRASAEQAEYLSGEEKVTLSGGQPTLEQPGRGFTRGAELTYYIDDDRLLVNGRPGARSETRRTLKRN